MSRKILFPSAAHLLHNVETESNTAENPLDVGEFLSFPTLAAHNSMVNHGYVEESTIPNAHIEYTQKEGKLKDESNNADSSSGWESDGSYERTKKRKRKKHKKNKKSKKKKKEKEKEESNKHKTLKETTKKPDTLWLDDTTLQFSEAFRKDPRPDKNNLQFNGLYKLDIAVYKHHVEWPCLGLGKKQTIEIYPRKKGKKLKKKDSVRYFKTIGTVVAYENNDNSNRFVNTVESINFIPLMSKSNNQAYEDVIKSQYLSSSYLEGNKKYSQELLDAPNNINLWLKFVDYQDRLVTEESAELFIKALRTPKAIIEKKISILEKAMLKNPTSEELILKYATFIKEIWPSEKVQEKWKQWLFQFPNRKDLWQEYLLYTQSNLLTTRVSTVVEAFRKCFRMLVGINEGTIRSHKPSLNAETELLTLFLQLVIFLWLAGHVEKSVSLLQCMIEYNIFCPEKFNLNDYTKEKKREIFEEYFESDATRFGDEDSVGWKFFVLGGWSGQDPIVPNNIISTESLVKLDFDKALLEHKQNEVMSETTSWYDLERIRECSELSPFRGEQEECEDTERIILYDDISFALFNLQNTDIQIQLILAYLLLLGVSVKHSLMSCDLLGIFTKFFIVIDNTEDEFSCPCHASFSCNFVSIQTNITLGGHQYTSFIVSRVRQVLSQSLKVFEGQHFNSLSEIWLHFELKLLWYQKHKENLTLDKKKLKNIQKFIKRLMKAEINRNCIELWTMYVCYEWNIGNKENSEKILCTVLSLCNNDDQILNVFHMSMTIRCMLDLSLDAHNETLTISFSPEIKNKLLTILLIFLDSNSSSHSNLSDTQQPNTVSLLHLSALLTKCFDVVRYQQDKYNDEDVTIQHFLCCHVVFRYCCNGIQALYNTFQDIESFFMKQTCEQSLVYSLLLMKKHCENDYSFFPQYRKAVETCLHNYPENIYINRFYVSIKRNGLDSLNVRRTYENFLQTCDHINPWLSAIGYEEQRLKCITLVPDDEKTTAVQFMDSKTGIHNRIRSLYQRMVDKEAFKYSTDVWMRYIKFELKYGSVKSAKQTFYTALRCCPASKEMYMLACQHLNSFQEIYDLMIEKEIRVKLITEELELLWNSS